MARYNEILVGRLNRYLQKFLQLKGDAPAPQLSSDWQPQVAFDGPSGDLRYLQGWETFGSFGNPPAAVGFNAGLLLRNPKGSGLIAVVERICVTLTTASFIEYSVGAVTADLATLNVTAGFDGRTRQFGAGCKVSQSSAGAGAPGLGVVGQFNVLAETPMEMILDQIHEFPLLPGFGVEVRDLTTNHAVSIALKWRERILEESEVS
jgi:hypothetical protein